MNSRNRLMRRRSLLKFGVTAGWLPMMQSAQTHASLNKPATVKHIITILLAGGLSQLDSFDPKPDSPSSVRGEFGSIQTAIAGVHFTEYLPKLAQNFLYCSSSFAMFCCVQHFSDMCAFEIE